MNLLITGAWKDATDYISHIEELGHTVVFMPDESAPLPVEPDWVEGVVCNGLFLRQDIRRFVNLQYVQLTSAGLDRVDVPYIREQGITLHTARDVYSIPIAEFCVASVLHMYKKMKDFSKQQADRIWKKIPDLVELYDKQVCIIGCGHIGRACARRFAAFGCRVVGVDCDITPRADFSVLYSVEDMDAVLSESDVVVLCVPLTEDTREMMDSRRIGLLKPTCVVVNVARGGVLDIGALTERLQMDELFAVLDVHDVEPLPQDSPLWEMERVFLTPHNSYAGQGNTARLYQEIITNLKEH